ncbi:hypothetical protein [Nocardiopsis oceani]
MGLHLPEAEEILDEAELGLGELELAATGEDAEWIRSAMVVCGQEVGEEEADLLVAPRKTGLRRGGNGRGLARAPGVHRGHRGRGPLLG